MHRSGQDTQLGGRPDGDARVRCLWLADPDRDLGVWQVARVRGGFVGGGADDDRAVIPRARLIAARAAAERAW